METTTPLKGTVLKKPSVITIGTFDGVHVGHQKIINRLINKATEERLTSVVLTFFPHPRMVLQQNSDLKLLNTIAERAEILSALGVEHIHIQEFTKEFAALSARDFVKKILVDQLKARHVIIGYDHHFGKNRSANIDDLILYGQEYGFEVEEIPVQDVEDVAVSSTKIRNALNQGDIHTANAYLGYPYHLKGMVVTGKGIGKKLGFPTANLQVDAPYKLIPQNGVYAVDCLYEGQKLQGMMSIGLNPTFAGHEKTIEVHIFDFAADLYGQDLTVEFRERLRDEWKFESVDGLIEQLKLDEIEARNALARYHG